MSQKRADTLNSFYRIFTPENHTRRAGLREQYIYRTFPQCVKCGKSFPKNDPVEYVQDKFEFTPGNIAVLRKVESLGDSNVMEYLMVVACNRGVGCWKDCHCGKASNQKCVKNCVLRGLPNASGFGLARSGDCTCICSCVFGCGNQGIYPCRCGHISRYHYPGCPIGLFKRQSSFFLPWKRQQMIIAGKIRERSLR